ncbi:MAG: helix-turn-helix transcriptional regulator [Lachnospiraceae bacterium]|nr:helix-turn-helix transcriptional regulator [Lachnospiraceae bacterium]
MIGTILKQLRLSKGKSQIELCSDLNIEQGTLANYENDRRVPKLDILIKIADYFDVSVDYLLSRSTYAETPVGDTLGYDGRDEHAMTFSNKLSNQIDFERAKIGDLASALGVEEKTILDWLSGRDDSYTSYYKQLSDFFKVSERYWTSPGAISPGIEPNLDEYNLILLYREYQKTGQFNSTYGNLEKYFQDLVIASNPDEEAIISDFRNMNQDSKDIIKGKIKEVLREQRYEESLKNETLPAASGK